MLLRFRVHTGGCGYLFRSLATTQSINRRGIHQRLAEELWMCGADSEDNRFCPSRHFGSQAGPTYRKLFAACNFAPCESLRFDFGGPNHFGPFFNFLQDEPAKFGRCHWHGHRPEIGKTLP